MREKNKSQEPRTKSQDLKLALPVSWLLFLDSCLYKDNISAILIKSFGNSFFVFTTTENGV